MAAAALNATLCLEARRILSYPGTIATHALLCLISIVGTTATAYVSWLVARHKVFHVNLRWLLTCLNLLLLTRSLMAFIRSAYYLLMLTSDDDCSLLWRVSRCTHFSEIVSKAVMVMSYAYLAIAIERLLALWLSKRYEHSNKQVLGIIGFVVVWFEYAIDFVRNTSSLIADDGSSSPYSVYCMSTSSVNVSLVDMLVGFRLVPISVLSLSLFIGICVYVKIRNRAWMRECNHNLTTRFQERITYKATRLILPNAIVFCCMYLMQLMAAVFSSIVAYQNNDKLGSVMVKELASLIFNSYSIIHPAIFLYIEPALWKEDERVQREDRREDRTTYNRTLAHTWEKSLKKREKRGFCCVRKSRTETYQRSEGYFGMPDDVSEPSYRLSYGRADVYPGSEACEAAAALNHNRLIWGVNALMAVESLAGLALCLFISIRVYRHEIFHINQRLLLVLIGLLLSVRSMFSLYKGGWLLMRLIRTTDNCCFLWHTRYCWDVSTVVSEPAFAVGYCYLAISLERLVACIFGARYENNTCPLLGAIGVLAILINTISVSAGHFPSAFFRPPPLYANSTFVVFCTSVAYPKIRWIDILYKFRQFPVMITSLLIFTPVFLWTKHKNRLRVTDSTHSLDDRFHRRMTLKSARIVYPNMICFTLLYAVSSTCTTLCAYLQTDGARVPLAVVIKEFGSLIFNAHLLAHPLILIWREPTLWRPARKPIEDPKLAHDQTRHFDLVQDAWNQVQFETKHEETKKKDKKENEKKEGLSLWGRISGVFARKEQPRRTTSPEPCDTHPKPTPRTAD